MTSPFALYLVELCPSIGPHTVARLARMVGGHVATWREAFNGRDDAAFVQVPTDAAPIFESILESRLEPDDLRFVGPVALRPAVSLTLDDHGAVVSVDGRNLAACCMHLDRDEPERVLLGAAIFVRTGSDGRAWRLDERSPVRAHRLPEMLGVERDVDWWPAVTPALDLVAACSRRSA